MPRSALFVLLLFLLPACLAYTPSDGAPDDDDAADDDDVVDDDDATPDDDDATPDDDDATPDDDDATPDDDDATPGDDDDTPDDDDDATPTDDDDATPTDDDDATPTDDDDATPTDDDDVTADDDDVTADDDDVTAPDDDDATPTDDDDATAPIDLDGDGHPADTDCDDLWDATYPGAPELCDGFDNNCDGTVPADERDLDADGWRPCEGDCNDLSPAAYPTAPEGCNGFDNDCDGSPGPLEADDDGDTWMICEGDCDDTKSDVYPGATELCDGMDTDCDGSLGALESDFDGDGYLGCLDDCNDNNANIFPGAPEIPEDGVDQDCDGSDATLEPMAFGLAVPQYSATSDLVRWTWDLSTGDLGGTNPLTFSLGGNGAASCCDSAMVLHPGGVWLYVVHNDSNLVEVLELAGDGTPTSIGTWAVGDSPSDAAFDEGSGTLYVISNDGIEAFSANAFTGELTELSASPFSASASSGLRDIVVSPTEDIAFAVSFNGSLEAFGILPSGGLFSIESTGNPLASRVMEAVVTPAGDELFLRDLDNGIIYVQWDTSRPAFTVVSSLGLEFGSSLAVTPDNNLLFTSGAFSNNLIVLLINPGSGVVLSPTSPVSSGAGIEYLTVGPNGRFLYAVAQDSSQVWIYDLDAANPITSAQALNFPSALTPGPLVIRP